MEKVFTVVCVDTRTSRPSAAKASVFEYEDSIGRTRRITMLHASWLVGCVLEIVRNGEVLARTTAIEPYNDRAGAHTVCHFLGLERASAFAYSTRVRSVSTGQLRRGDQVVVSGPLQRDFEDMLLTELSIHDEWVAKHAEGEENHSARRFSR